MKYENATKKEVIKALKLVKKQKAFDDKPLPKEIEVWTAEIDTPKATYHYTLDNLFEDDDNYTLVVERFSKTAQVWSELFNAYIPRKTMHTYCIKP